MQLKRVNKSATEVMLHITVSGPELKPIKEKVLRQLANQVTVTGFRPGKAPLNLVEKQVDQQTLLDRFVDEALNQFYSQAIIQENLRPVQQPKVSIKKFVPYTELTFDAEMVVIGEIKLPDYTNIKLTLKPTTVSDQDIDQVIESLRLRIAERRDVDRPAKTNDEVVIDFKGTDSKGSAIAGADGTDYPLVLGSKSFIPGFEDNLEGLSKNDTKSFTVTFPTDYNAAALQGQKATFKVSVKAVREVILPVADDDFAAKTGPFKTLNELKEDIKRNLSAERQRQAQSDYENELIYTIADKTDLAIPETLVDEQVRSMEEDEKRNLLYRGQTWEEHLKQEGQTEEEHRVSKRPQALQRVKAGLVLAEISERENIQVTPEELELRIQALKGQYQDAQMQAELDKPENRRDIASRLATEKTIAKLVEYTSK